MSIENLEKIVSRREHHNSFNTLNKEMVENDIEKIKYFSSRDLLATAFKDIKDTKTEDFVSYGYNFLDNHLGGIYKGDLILIGGETGTGKTVFANNIAIKASKQNHKVAIWSLEDNPVSVLKNRLYVKINELRLKDNKSRYPFIAFWKNELNGMEFFRYRTNAYNELQEEVKDNLLYIDINQTPTIDLLEKQIIELTEAGVELLVIDHLHKFNFKQQGGGKSKADAIEEFMNRLRLVQDKTGMRIILIVHYAKLNGAKPILDSFKDSIAIPQNASVVINLWRDRGQSGDEDSTGSTKIMLPKIRIPVPEVTFDAKFNLETNDYEDDMFVFGTEQGDEYQKSKEKEKKQELKNKFKI